MAENSQPLKAIRHSLAHLLADTVKQMYPGSLNAIGPTIDDGFYQDFEINGQLSENDIPKIENEMRKSLKNWDKFDKQEVSLEEAREIFKNNKYKLELVEEFAKGGKQLTVYTAGGFADLCKGGHSDQLSKIDPRGFKLTKTAGAYWRGDEKNIMLTRIYGVAFETEEQLKKHLEMLEEAKKRDHRKIGQELDLFVFSDLVGSGLPMFTPRGAILREEISKYSNELREKYGFEKVWVPHITKKELYEVSGHWTKFGDELFLVKSQETSDQLVMKPMNCPHHTQIFASKPRSYKDLPMRYLETTTVYRDEKTGELGGLSRVRSITQDDSHVFCAQKQIEDELNKMIEATVSMYQTVGMELSVRLSYRDDSEAYLGSQQIWKNTEAYLKNVVIKNKLNFYEEKGEAAFYGPKIDFMATDAIGRKHQVSTIQLDFVMPERFGLEFTGDDGTIQTPIMLHYAILGSIERFLSVYIEHTAGKFPPWLAPEQIRIITVANEDSMIQYAKQLAEQAKELELRVKIDDSRDSLGKKIRSAEIEKVPYVVVIGKDEVESQKLVPRVRKDLEVQAEHSQVGAKQFLITVANEVKSRITKTSL